MRAEQTRWRSARVVSQLLPDAESVGDYTLDDLLGTVLGHRKIGVHVPEQKSTARASNFLFFSRTDAKNKKKLRIVFFSIWFCFAML
jgi:hypothetical protein